MTCKKVGGLNIILKDLGKLTRAHSNYWYHGAFDVDLGVKEG